MSQPTHVIVDKRNHRFKQAGKWRVGVLYDPKHGRVHLASYKHKNDALTAGHTLARQLKTPLTIYTASGAYGEAVTKDYT